MGRGQRSPGSSVGWMALAATALVLTGAMPPLGLGARMARCFAPGTPPEIVERQVRPAAVSGMPHSLMASWRAKYQYDDQHRWRQTATDRCCRSQGDPVTLTWSVVPDGTAVYGYNGEATAPSDLRSFLDGIYGSEEAWLPIFKQVFERWGALTGVRYVYEPADDGRAWTMQWIDDGELGVRGDVRIAGHRIDGPAGVLAYNFFPESGDMVLDTGDTFYYNTSGDSLRLRNTLAHEHGHGLGIRHVCPVDGTKLMEPFINVTYDGPQHDDVLAANRGYGDPSEGNDAAGVARQLGLLDGALEIERSIDDNSDIDFYSFETAAAGSLDVALTPIGAAYYQGPQGTGGCTSGSSYDSLTTHDLAVRILAEDGSTELAVRDAGGPGVAERLDDLSLSGPGHYYVEVSGDGTNGVQLYRLTLETAIGPGIFADGFESGDVASWN